MKFLVQTRFVSRRGLRLLIASLILLIYFFTRRSYKHVSRHKQEYRLAASSIWRGRCSLPFYRKTNYTFLTNETLTHSDGRVQKLIMLRDVLRPGFFIENDGICTGNVSLIVTVLAAPANISARNAIRETWGVKLKERRDAKLVFVLGATTPDLQRGIEEEQKTYGDLIQTVNADHNRQSLTMKEISLFRWLQEFCPSAKFVLKTDDDVYVNPDELFKFMQKNSNATNSMYGLKMPRHCTDIDFNEDRKVVNSSSPPEIYPYLHVPVSLVQSYLYTRDVIDSMAGAINVVPYWTLVSDEYATGILAQVAGVKRVSAPRFNVQFGESALKISPTAYRILFKRAIIVSHNQFKRPRSHITPEQMRMIHEIFN